MVAEVCSVYVLRADNVLELYATEGLKRERRAPAPADASGSGLVGTHRRGGAAAQPARRAVAPGLRLPAGDRRGDLPLLPRRADAARRPHARRARRAEPLQPHLYRGGGRGAADHRDGARRDVRLRRDGAARRGPAPTSTSTGRCSFKGAPSPRASPSATSCCTSRASSSPSSSPRTSSTSCAGSTRRWRACGSRSTTCWRAAPSPSRASTARSSKPTGCSPRTAAGCGGCRRRCSNGLTAEAAVEKVQSDTRARMPRQTDPFLRDRLHDFDDLANRLLRELMGRAHGPLAGDLPRGRHHRRPQHGRRPSCSTTTASGCAAWCWRRAAPTSHVAIVARALGIATVGQLDDVVSLAETGDRDHRRRRRRRGASPAAVRHRDGLCREGALPRPPAGAVPRSSATSRRSPGTASRIDAADECRAGRRHAASCEVGRRRHRPVPHRAAVHGRVELSARSSEQERLYRAGARRGATASR